MPFGTQYGTAYGAGGLGGGSIASSSFVAGQAGNGGFLYIEEYA